MFPKIEPQDLRLFNTQDIDTINFLVEHVNMPFENRHKKCQIVLTIYTQNDNITVNYIGLSV